MRVRWQKFLFRVTAKVIDADAAGGGSGMFSGGCFTDFRIISGGGNERRA